MNAYAMLALAPTVEKFSFLQNRRIFKSPAQEAMEAVMAPMKAMEAAMLRAPAAVDIFQKRAAAYELPAVKIMRTLTPPAPLLGRV